MQRWNLLLHDILRTAASAVSEESWQKEKEAGREELGLRAEGGKGGGGGVSKTCEGRDCFYRECTETVARARMCLESTLTRLANRCPLLVSELHSLWAQQRDDLNSIPPLIPPLPPARHCPPGYDDRCALKVHSPGWQTPQPARLSGLRV